MPFHQLPPRVPTFDVNKTYVRFRDLRDDGYVEFDFAVGEPGLSVELTLPLAAYQAFCKEMRVTYLTREQAEAVDFDHAKWRFGSPGLPE